MQKLNDRGDSRRLFVRKLLLGSAGAAVGIPLLMRVKNSIPRLYSERQKMMGTWVAISVFSDDEKRASDAIRKAFAEMRLIDSLMSIHQENSQVSAINRLSGSESVRVDSRVIEVLRTAQEFSERTSGRYDVTILPVMKLFGFYGASPASIPKDREIAQALGSVGYRDLEVDAMTNSVGLKKKGSGIDLGSIGKGYAVERAAQVLRAEGITSSLIDAGGNLYAMGAPYGDSDPRGGWRIGVRDPRGEGREPLETVVLRDQAVATSNLSETKIRIASAEVSHIFNAVTGRPLGASSATCQSCTVIVSGGMQSDVLSTAGYLLGREEAQSKLVPGTGAVFHFFG